MGGLSLSFGYFVEFTRVKVTRDCSSTQLVRDGALFASGIWQMLGCLLKLNSSHLRVFQGYLSRGTGAGHLS